MAWNPFRRTERASKQEEDPGERHRIFAEDAARAGFNLDFSFESKPAEEALINELRDIEVKTFWANNPMDGKVDESNMSPEGRAEHQALMARKAEILAHHKEELRTYLQPYLEAAEVWKTGEVTQRVLDRALDYWMNKYGMQHRQRFLAAFSVLED